MTGASLRRPAGTFALCGLLLAGTFQPASAQVMASPDAFTAGAVAGRSLLVPGWGQRAQGQTRAWVYAAAEVVAWAFWLERRSAAAQSRTGYRDLAWAAARGAPNARADGDWTYYETLSKWQRSGAFDRDGARAGTQPEQDPASFNGFIWQRASDLFFGGGAPPSEDAPAHARAVEYYEAHAYGPAYLWDWSGQDSDLHRYKALIHESDDRFHQATTALGAVLVNHLLSAIDGYVSARVPADARLRVAPGEPGLGGWTLSLELVPVR